MNQPQKWNERYLTGDLPWETGRVDSNLERVVAEHNIAPCPALELGCGTGNNALRLAGRGFDVTAVDMAKEAVLIAGRKAAEAQVNITFLQGDVLSDTFPNAPFGFVFDRGCFHSFDLQEERKQYVETAYRNLVDGGYWMSLIGSTDGPPREVGPPRRSAADIALAVEPRFEIIRLTSTTFDSDMTTAPRAWSCLMQKRE